MRHGKLVLLPLLVVVGCSDTRSGPELRAMTPNQGLAGRELRDVAIEGARFFVRVHSAFDDDETQIDATYTATLVGAGQRVELVDVTHVSQSKLTVTVPETLAHGVYALEVTDPWGHVATLPEAFEVRTSADLGPDAPAEQGLDAGRDGPKDQGSEGPADQGADAPADQGADAPADQGADVDGQASPDGAPDGSAADAYTGDLDPPTGTLQLLASDPFGDGTAFAFVFAYRGAIHLGPRKDGAGALRMQPDGTLPTPETFAVPADVNGNKTDNSATPPYVGFGAAGCQKDTLACGPDNENARGLFASGTIAGQQWLVAAGGKTSKDFDYVYMTNDTDTQLDFRYVDLNQQLGGGTTALSAARIFGDRVYLGLSDDGGSKPFLIVLKTTPSAPGLDAVKPTDAESLFADKLPGIGGQRSIDSFGELNGRLYLANPGGCVRSTTAQPRDANNHPGDWAVCTPSAGTYTAKVSLPANKLTDLEPIDKAVPAFATFQGRLYMARHTTTGPQLWGCSPAAHADPTQCDPGDWFLVAGNSVGDLELTQFDHPANASIGLLVATSTHLYVGFENATDGVMIYRSSVAAPTSRADFTGLAGCSAAQTSCAGLGGHGLGLVPKMTRILDGTAATFGARDYVYLVVNDGSGAVRVLRIGD